MKTEDCRFKVEIVAVGCMCAATEGECQFTVPGSGLGCPIRDEFSGLVLSAAGGSGV